MTEEFKELWEEKKALEKASDELPDDDSFEPAKETEMNPNEALIHVVL